MTSPSFRYIHETILNPFVRGRVLEIGPHEGHFTKIIEPLATDLTVLEMSDSVVTVLNSRFPSVRVIKGDFHFDIPCEDFDTVVALGVAYHTPHVFLLLEQIVNRAKPTTIILDGFPSSPAFSMLDEQPNRPGMRYSEGRTICKVMVVSLDIITTCMATLGYRLAFHGVCPPDPSFKSEWDILVFQSC